MQARTAFMQPCKGSAQGMRARARKEVLEARKDRTMKNEYKAWRKAGARMKIKYSTTYIRILKNGDGI